MKILVLFDGAGLARLGLEQAGHVCVGVELDPIKHHFSKTVGSGTSILGDVRDWTHRANEFDAVWASPPCAQRSTAIKDLTRKGGYRNLQYQGDFLQWCFEQPWADGTCWVENVTIQGSRGNDWGFTYNAAQFLKVPVQNRNRVIGGNHPLPRTFHNYRRWFPGICPCISATEYKGCASDRLRASRFYGRKLTVDECAWHMGFKIPKGWRKVPDWYMPDYKNRAIQWERRIYEAIGDGVPVYMAKAFGKACK